MYDIKDILGHGLWTLGHGLWTLGHWSWVLPIFGVMHDVMQWVMGFGSSSMDHGLWTWVLGHEWSKSLLVYTSYMCIL
jgi:hypothetical protein